ncbi:MAG: flagellar basal body rod protein FlgB [Myxococcaceae bacterium]|nr:flagellar basal body rod protein FlgB [Myxococcaceae bacterium]
MKLFDGTLTALERSLDVRLEKQNLLASNAANLDTPGYQARELDFDAAMQSVLAPGGDAPGAVETAVRAATHAVEGTAGLDGNGVDLDRTMVELAENGLQYGAAAKAAGKKLAILKYVANDGNG